jgi:hypothetical protein
MFCSIVVSFVGSSISGNIFNTAALSFRTECAV